MCGGNISVTHFVDFTLLSPIISTYPKRIMQTTTTKAIISRDKLMEYIHEDRDLLMGLQDDLSDMLSATGRYSITLDEIVQNYMPTIPLYLIENEDEIKQAYPDRVTDDEYIFIYDKDMTPNEITLNVEWRD